MHSRSDLELISKTITVFETESELSVNKKAMNSGEPERSRVQAMTG